HSFRLQATSRELLPDSGASEALLQLPLRSSKSSAGYRFLDESPPSADQGQRVAVSAEASGLLGDVAVARAETSWSGWGPLGSGSWRLSAGLGLVAPLVAGAKTPWEERFFLGGTAGQGPGERLPGFAAHGVGPSE
ncbi:unnamed protein product, partial [Polarella glacialis]